MPRPVHPQHPALTPDLCLQTDALRSFLRLSRASIDDTISQHFSSMNRPSEQPFDPASFSAARSSTPSRRSLPPQSCAAFVSHTLFPAWAARARVLEHCAVLAETQIRDQLAGSQPSDIVHATNGGAQWGGTIKGGSMAIGAGVVGPEALNQRRDEHSPTTAPIDAATAQSQLKLVDERLDPYSSRDYTDETPGERIARVVREEKSVEGIVRARSWGVVRDRCGSSVEDWEDGMKRWESEMSKPEFRTNESQASSGSLSGGFWSVRNPRS